MSTCWECGTRPANREIRLLTEQGVLKVHLCDACYHFAMTGEWEEGEE